MEQITQTCLFLAVLATLHGCVHKGPYDPSNEHCSLWYITGLEPSAERLELQTRCLNGYYQPGPAPQTEKK